MSSFSATVTITSLGGLSVHSLQVLQGDDTKGNVAASYGLADPLVISQKLVDDARLPMSHPEPDEATFAIIAPDATTYSDVAIGDPVGIQLYPVRDLKGTPVTFYGRVASVQGDPHPLGVKLTVSCVDYLADLAELQVGKSNYPLETATARLNRITDEAQLPRFPVATPAGATTLPVVQIAARTAGITDAFSMLKELLDSSSFASGSDENGVALAVTGSNVSSTRFRPYLVPVITNGLLDPTTPFQVRIGAPFTRRVMYAPPYRVTNVAGTYKVTVSAADSSPSTGCPILSASRVEFAPSFSQSKGTQLPNVTIGVDAQGNRYVWDWRTTDKLVPGGGALVGGVLVPYAMQQSTVNGPPIIQEVDSIVDVSDAGGGGAADSWSSGVYHYMVPFRPSTLTDWAIGTMSYQAWAEPTWVISWTGLAQQSTSELRRQDGTVETNLVKDPQGLGGAPTTGWVLNSGTLAKDPPNAWRSIGNPLKLTTTVDNWGYLDASGASSVLDALTVGKTYTFRVVVKSDTAQSVRAIQYGTNAANGASTVLSPGLWAALTVTWTMGATGFLSVRRTDGTPLLGNVWLAAFMVVEGTSISLNPANGTPFWGPGDPADVQWRRPQLTELLTVAGAAPGKLPNNREWISGLVTGTSLKVQGGRVTVDVDVAPPTYEWKANREQLGSSLGVASLDSPAVTALTLSQLGTRDTFDDYSRVRGS